MNFPRCTIINPDGSKKEVSVCVNVQSGSSVNDVSVWLKQKLSLPESCRTDVSVSKDDATMILDDTSIYNKVDPIEFTFTINEEGSTTGVKAEVDEETPLTDFNNTLPPPLNSIVTPPENCSNFGVWCAENEFILEQLFKKLIPENRLFFESVDLCLYFDSPKLRPSVVILAYPHITEVLEFHEAAKKTMYKCLLVVFKISFPLHNGAYQDLRDLLNIMKTWLHNPIFDVWLAQGTTGSLNNAIRAARSRFRRQNGLNPVRPGGKPLSSSLDQLNATIDDVSARLRFCTQNDEIRKTLSDSRQVRLQWLSVLKKNDGFNVVKSVIEKFPLFQDNVGYLHDDYVEHMRQLYNFEPDVIATITKSASALVAVGNAQNCSGSDSTDTLINLLSLLMQLVLFYKKDECQENPSMSKLLLVTDLSLQAAIERKNETTTAAMIIKRKWDFGTYFIAIEDFALKLQSDSFSSAFQNLFEVNCLFDLEHDPDMISFFSVLENLSGLKCQILKAGPQMVIQAIDYYKKIYESSNETRLNDHNTSDENPFKMDTSLS